MSHVYDGPIARYNSLQDKHLSGFFSNNKMRHHLIKAGLISKNGNILSEEEWRVRENKRQHRNMVKGMLSQGLVKQTIEVEHQRQGAIRKKLEEIAKVELVKRVRAQRGRKGDEDVLPFLLHPCVARSSSAPGKRDPTAVYTYDDGEAAPCDGGFSDQEIKDRDFNCRRPKARDNPYPKERIDSRYLSALDQVALTDYSTQIEKLDLDAARAPYTNPQPRRVRTAPPGGVRQRPHGVNPRLYKPLPRNQHALRIQSMAEVTMQFLGLPGVADPVEVEIEQQHNGGNTLTVFKHVLSPNDKFRFVSRRHRNFPFSLSLYVDGLFDCRLSTCCEYKHSKGCKLGGPNGHFMYIGISGAAPCYKCQLDAGLNLSTRPINSNKSNRKKKRGKSAGKGSGEQTGVPRTEVEEEEVEPPPKVEVEPEPLEPDVVVYLNENAGVVSNVTPQQPPTVTKPKSPSSALDDYVDDFTDEETARDSRTPHHEPPPATPAEPESRREPAKRGGSGEKSPSPTRKRTDTSGPKCGEPTIDKISATADTINLDNLSLDDEKFAVLLKKLEAASKLEKLIVRECGIDDGKMKAISTAVIKSGCPLKLICLNLNHIGPGGIIHIVRLFLARPTLKMILLYGNPLGDKGVSVLIDGVYGKAESDAGTSSESSAFDDDSGIRVMLTHLDLGEVDLTSSGMIKLAKLIDRSPSLKVLNLGANSAVSLEGWKALGRALSGKNYPTKLSLSHSRLGNKGVSSLADAISDNTGITLLDVESCGIGDEGAESLLSLNDTNITTLEVDGNRISDGKMKALREMFHQ